jgi:uncharacterized protein YeeX (DUF496 family)
MSDNSEKCPVCNNELKEHRVKNFIDCIEKLFEKNKGKRHNLMNPTKLILTGNAKIQEALKIIDELIEDYENVYKVYVISSHSGDTKRHFTYS